VLSGEPRECLWHGGAPDTLFFRLAFSFLLVLKEVGLYPAEPITPFFFPTGPDRPPTVFSFPGVFLARGSWVTVFP